MRSLLHQQHSGYLESPGALQSDADGSNWEVNAYTLLSLDKQNQLRSIVTKVTPLPTQQKHSKSDSLFYDYYKFLLVLLLGNQRK